jgi:hypothetical protein
MMGDFDSMYDYAQRYLTRGKRLDAARETQKACAYWAMASAFQLMPSFRQYRVPRGQYYQPMATGGFGSVPDMDFLRAPETVTFLRGRLARLRHPLRRGRVADVVWEFGGDPTAARIAADSYREVGRAGVGSTREHAPMYGAAALARALMLSRALSDWEGLAETVRAILGGIEALARTTEHVALFILVEVLLEAGVPASDLARADEILRAWSERLKAEDADNFNFRKAVLKLRRELALHRGDKGGAAALPREHGETLVREAGWKHRHYPNGGLVAMTIYEDAARHFEEMGDPRRAEEIRVLERAAYGDARFGRVEAAVTLDVSPYRDWLERLLRAGGPDRLWPAILEALPLPTAADLAARQDDERRAAPLMSRIGVAEVPGDEVVERVPAEEAARRDGTGSHRWARPCNIRPAIKC